MNEIKMKKTYSPTEGSNKKPWLILVIFILVVGSVLVYFFVIKGNEQKPQQETGDSYTTDYVNLDPPSEAEKDAATAKKDEIINNSDSQNSNPTSSVSPVISTWSQSSKKNLELSGFVPGIVEDGGKCILVMEKDSNKVTTEKSAKSDAQSTICGVIEVDITKLSTGIWKTTLNYESAKYKGSSDKVDVEIST